MLPNVKSRQFSYWMTDAVYSTLVCNNFDSVPEFIMMELKAATFGHATSN
jgi:hypothetical protein